ncbi:Type I restriction-modification system, specificity subunit S [Rhodovulum sp. PH10]|uniref:restriction endonuclease subunit S n=1 Tax=Rhodovulum sp. PH10 TaxID=1187851 RepID=UPI00027C2C3F|nr:restriction endonuclease subunit S [Rhodovulum sp. PH10]EJW11611.1 Type I restriction-modification system, specificity subunit S [Rhodovulum sp. PH10]
MSVVARSCPTVSPPVGMRPLGEVIEFRNDIVHPKDRPHGPATFVGLEHIERDTGIRIGSEQIRLEDMTGRRARFCRGDIVYGYLRPYLNKVWIAEFDGLCSVDQYVFKVRSIADRNYVAYFLRSDQFLKTAPIGISPGQLPRIRSGEIVETLIPLPPLDEQRRIATILDQADDLRRKRRQALEYLTLLPQAFFTNMFGDWSRPGFNGRLFELGERIDFLTSGSRGWAEFYRETGDLFIRIQNVKHDELDLGDVAFVNPPPTAEARRTRVQPGDVLLSITADLGRTAVIPTGIGDAYINQHLSIIRSSRLEPRYLSAALASRAGQAIIQRKNREGVKAGLNFDDIRTLRVPDVPLDLQRAFAARVAEIDALKAKHRAHLAKLDALFASLQHRAFRGEL